MLCSIVANRSERDTRGGTPNQSWQNQGRQGHGWFGHGTGPGNDPSTLGPLDERAGAAAQTAFMALPRALHSRTGVLYGLDHAGRLKALLSRWSGAVRLSDDAFAGHFFGRSAGDRVAQALQAAARTIVAAKTQADLRGAAEQVATAIQAVGLGNWGRFMADAQERADSPATVAAIAASQPRPAAVVPDAAIIKVAAPAGPPTPDMANPDQPVPPAAAAEPEHGRIWQWLHGLGLAKTRHEQATDLRRVMGSAGGLVYMREGVPLNVDQMSDDEVLALNRGDT